jgi:hypothetical protein
VRRRVSFPVILPRKAHARRGFPHLFGSHTVDKILLAVVKPSGQRLEELPEQVWNEALGKEGTVYRKAWMIMDGEQ